LTIGYGSTKHRPGARMHWGMSTCESPRDSFRHSKTCEEKGFVLADCPPNDPRNYSDGNRECADQSAAWRSKKVRESSALLRRNSKNEPVGNRWCRLADPVIWLPMVRAVRGGKEIGVTRNSRIPSYDEHGPRKRCRRRTPPNEMRLAPSASCSWMLTGGALL